VTAHDDGVVAGAGVEAIGASSPAHVVAAAAAPEAVVSAAGENAVVAVAAVDVVGAATRDDKIVAATGIEAVSAAPAAQHVIARVPPVRIVDRGSREDVRVGGATGGFGLRNHRQRQERSCNRQ